MGNIFIMMCVANNISGAIRTTCILDLETKPHYWLTVCAQDQAVVPLYSCVEVKLFYLPFFFLHLFSVLRVFVLNENLCSVDKTFPISKYVLNNTQHFGY